ncbi:ABC transporter substrate-binding protein [Paucidesulfovibrio longus]|uniref:ABC transporter substrate-binding protein n=1 Tax=Paucidesulfovibrio longus TaxID=889 RepID=UPI0003B6A2AF|nr:ABC transporter substrate-binding protein [Paucidesulfovibrio longus]
MRGFMTFPFSGAARAAIRLAAPLLCLCLLAWAALPGPARAGQRLERASLILQWTPQAQFAGFYMAREKGFYEARGVNMMLIPGGPDRVASDWLDSRNADFCTMFLSTALERYDSGMPLVNVGQFLHHSALMIITRKGMGIRKPADLDRRKLSMWANEFQIQPRALFRSLGVNPVYVPLGASMDLFLRGAVHATLGMWYNEYHTILSAGLRENELEPIFFRDTDFDFPEDGIYCLRSTAEQRPEVVRAVVEATREGWQYAFAHEQETLDVIMAKMEEAGLPATRVHQLWMLRRMKDVIEPSGSGGISAVLDPETFRHVVGVLKDSDVIRQAPLYEDFYKGPENDR